VAAFDPYQARRILWRIMLAALGVSAAAAVVVVLTNLADVGQMMGHLVVAAIATALMLVGSKMVDWPKTRLTGLFAMAVLLVQFLLIAAGIWGKSDRFLAVSLGFFVSAIPAIAFFQAAQSAVARRAGMAGLAMSVLVFLCFCAAALIQAFGSDYGQFDFWLLAWESWICMLGIVFCLVGWGTDHRHWRWLGVAACLAFLTDATRLQFMRPTPSSAPHELVILGMIAIVIAQCNQLFALQIARKFNPFRLMAIAFAIAAAGVTIWSDYYDANPIWQMTPAQRLFTALWICAGSASAALVIVARFNRKPDPVKATMEFRQLAIVCPHCGKKQTMPLGESACSDCGLKFNLSVTEPRCPQCSYLLLMNKSDRCPECGTPIGAELRVPSSELRVDTAR